MASFVLLCAGTIVQTAAEARDRTIPRPLPSHPGNIFVVAETIVVPVPGGGSNTWRAVDYDANTLAQGQVESGLARIGQLPVGYYEVAIEGRQDARRISLGVLEPLRAATPLDSPIGVDVAMAWFYAPEKMAEAASLCQLAGMNRVRDRLQWAELEPHRGEFSASNRYDLSLRIQAEAGLKVLQVNHSSPDWANANSKRFPEDLRDVYSFYCELAHRWGRELDAFEPWNEADIRDFGGHTGDQIASLQKAAYLGLKAGNPDLTVCQNVFAIHRSATLDNFNDNRAWPYFDTFNLHHYEPLENYPKLYGDFRAVSAGRPLWVSECSVTVPWSGDEQLKEPDAENLRVQSERVAKIYATSIYQGAQAVFYFMLPHYSEGKTQFGLLHADLTPRPGYLALAAAGRLLAGARPIGRVNLPSIQGYVFRAQPDGRRAEVLVIWSHAKSGFELAKPPEACFDHLGRAVSVTGKSLKLTQAPLFVLLAKGSRPALVPPPQRPPMLGGKPWPLVLQAALPAEKIDLEKSGYKLAVGRTNAIPVVLYNFGASKAQGELHWRAPKDWPVNFSRHVELAPGERKEIILNLVTPKNWALPARLTVNGDFAQAGAPVLALRFFPSPDTLGK